MKETTTTKLPLFSDSKVEDASLGIRSTSSLLVACAGFSPKNRHFSYRDISNDDMLIRVKRDNNQCCCRYSVIKDSDGHTELR